MIHNDEEINFLTDVYQKDQNLIKNNAHPGKEKIRVPQKWEMFHHKKVHDTGSLSRSSGFNKMFINGWRMEMIFHI